MTRSEWEAVAEAWSGASVQGDVDGLLRALLAGKEPVSQPAEVTRIVVQPGVEALASYRPAPALPPTQQAEQKNEGSVASDVIKTIGMVTGVGPMITGLLKLFGGGDDPKASVTAPIPYSLPEQVSVEAGLASDRSFVGIGYAANGGARALNTTRISSERGAPQIHINVQAMDSRSFADHSDDIARAVREAMLRSHSLNDVIAEI
jgi:hypothetical protein